MRIDAGKDAKRSGAVKPSVARKVDGVKPTHAPGKTNQAKPFGYEYQYRWWKGKEWKTQRVWFRKRGHRDQAMADFRKGHRGILQDNYRDPVPVESEGKQS